MVTQRRIDPGEFGDEEQHEGESYLAWSADGPPYYELAEAKGTGLHSIERHGAGFHHAGLFVADVEEAIAHVEALGVKIEGRVLGEDGRAIVCWTVPSEATGISIEYIDERIRPIVQSWIDTGVRPQPGAVNSSSRT
jgi:hypothetical protein